MNSHGPMLRDIHVPPSGWWPPALGWWIVAALVLLVVALVWWWWRRHVALRPLRAALREIDALGAAYLQTADSAALATDASRLLRRVALRIEPEVAARHGARWRTFLRRYAGDDAAAARLESLAESPFVVYPALDAEALTTALRTWCRNAMGRRRKNRFDASGAQPPFTRRLAASRFMPKGPVTNARDVNGNGAS